MKFKDRFLSLFLALALISTPAFATYQPQNPNGQATMANSSPVAIASDQTLPLPSGAATASAQATGNSSLATVATNTGNIPAKGSATGANSTPVVIASDQVLPLPTGAATSAAQTTGNSSLSTIATNSGNIPTNGQKAMSASLPVALASDQSAIPAPLPVVYTGTTITRPADTTAYAAGDALYSTTSGSQAVANTIQISRAADQYSTLMKMRFKMSGTVITNGIFRIHLYNSQPTLTNGDNGAWLTGSTGYVGCFDVTISQTFSDGSIGQGIPCAGSQIATNPVSGQNYLYYTVEVRAAFTPISAEVFTPSVEVQ